MILSPSRVLALAVCCCVAFFFAPKAQAQTVTQQTTSQNRYETSTIIHVAQPIESSTAASMATNMPQNYPGKIVSCTVDTVAQTITFVHSNELARIDLLQLLTQLGYPSCWYIDGEYKVFLNAAGNDELREQMKQF